MAVAFPPAMRPLPAPALDADQVLAFVLVDVAVILVAATLLGALARRLRQPTVVGHIVAGIALGPTLLGPGVFTWGRPWAALHCDAALAASGALPSVGSCLFPPQARSVLGILGQIALVLYMLLVGLELDPRMLRGRGRGVATVAVGALAVPLAFGLLIGPLLYGATFTGAFGTPAQPSRLAFSLMVGAILSVGAFPVMAHILNERGMARTTMGSTGIAAAAALTVLMFLAVAAADAIARQEGVPEILATVALAGGYVAVMLVVVRRALAPLGRAVEARGTLSSTHFAVILALAFASALVAERIGINVITGAFLLGAVIPARSIVFPEMAARIQEVTVTALLPIFLAFSGLNTDLSSVPWSAAGGILVLLVAGVVAKLGGGAVSARLGGLGWGEASLLGVLMNCRGLLVLVVALVAVDAGVISPVLQVGAVVMALVTTAMTGPLFDALVRRVILVDVTYIGGAAKATWVRPGQGGS